VAPRALREVAGTPVSADRPGQEEPELPLLQYDDARRFPLWGVPGKEAPEQDEQDGEDEG